MTLDHRSDLRPHLLNYIGLFSSIFSTSDPELDSPSDSPGDELTWAGDLNLVPDSRTGHVLSCPLGSGLLRLESAFSDFCNHFLYLEKWSSHGVPRVRHYRCTFPCKVMTEQTTVQFRRPPLCSPRQHCRCEAVRRCLRRPFW